MSPCSVSPAGRWGAWEAGRAGLLGTPNSHATTLPPLPKVPAVTPSRLGQGMKSYSLPSSLPWKQDPAASCLGLSDQQPTLTKLTESSFSFLEAIGLSGGPSHPGLSLFMSAVLLRGFILLPSPLPRIMRPDDANVAGNVHGGTILKMIEEAGAIISTRHCNSQNGVSVWGPSHSLHGRFQGPGGTPCSTAPLLGFSLLHSLGLGDFRKPWVSCLVWGPAREDRGQPECELTPS